MMRFPKGGLLARFVRSEGYFVVKPVLVMNGRRLSGTENNSTEWRKQQLNNLERKFETFDETTSTPVIETSSELQSMWRALESRVTRRRSLTTEERKGVVGRRNIKRTDEDVWLEEGLYDDAQDDTKEKK